MPRIDGARSSHGGDDRGMADYYLILAKAVSVLEPNTGRARQQLYDRARSAVITEMERAYPPFHGSEVAAAKQALENAIEMVEAEAVRRKSNKMGASTPGNAGPVIAVSVPRSIQNGEVRSSRRTTFIGRILGFKKAAGTLGSPNCSIAPRARRTKSFKTLLQSGR